MRTHVFVWKPHWDHERVDMSRCRASVNRGRGGLSQCLKKGTKSFDDDGVTYKFCTVHHPDAVAARREQMLANIDKEKTLSNRRYECKVLRREIADALVSQLRASGTVAVTPSIRKKVEKLSKLDDDQEG